MRGRTRVSRAETCVLLDLELQKLPTESLQRKSLSICQVRNTLSSFVCSYARKEKQVEELRHLPSRHLSQLKHEPINY
jgi:hypothetical protein